MTQFSAIDLSALPAPSIIEQVDYESILAAMLADLVERYPEFDALVESDPAFKILEVAAYRETLVRQRVNEAARAVMLAYAAGTDLDQIGANYNVERLLVDPGDPDAVPPIDPIYEADDDFRRRIQLSPEGHTTAGSAGSYVFHTLSADAQVRDAQATSPLPGDVSVYVLSKAGQGAADTVLIETVEAALNAENVRPLTDRVTVLSASITEYEIEASLTVLPGPDAEVVRIAALDAAQAYADQQHRLGYDITISGLMAALHQSGVHNVNLISPADSIVMGEGEAAYCTSVTVTVSGTDV